MKPCPYRKEHEYDAEGLCAHCFAKAPPPPPAPEPPVLEGLDSAFAVSPSTQSIYYMGVAGAQGYPVWSSSPPAPLTQQQINDILKGWGKP